MSIRETPIVVCWTTIGDQSGARELAKSLLQRRVAACVQIDSIESHYRWDGELCCEPEWRLTIKTSLASADGLMESLRELHPYDQPQIVMVHSSDVDSGYHHWVSESTNSES